MSSPICGNCNVSMLAEVERAGLLQLRRFHFCPRCRASTEGVISEGQIEVEEPWFLEVRIPERLSALQLKAIRKSHPSFASIGLAETKRFLVPSTTVRLGPYDYPSHVVDSCARLREAGLTATEEIGLCSESPFG